MKRMVIKKYSHHFSIRNFKPDVKKILLSFARRKGEMGSVRTKRGKFIRALVRVYASSSVDRSFFRFHINDWREFENFVKSKGVSFKDVTVIQKKLYKSVKTDLEYHDKRTPRGEQQKMIDFILSDGMNKVITLEPGGGKTFITLKAMSIINERTFFCIKSGYIDKWIPDVEEAFKIKRGDLVTVRGANQLKSLLNLGISGELKASVILVSNATIRTFIKTYEKYGEGILNMGYACTPIDMWKVLGIGLRVVDEAHEQLHFCHKLDLYTNVKKTIALSGTLFSDDPFINNMMEIIYPLKDRYNTEKLDVFISATGIYYSIPNVEKRVKYMNHALNFYSHVKFEKSIFRNNKLRDNYSNFIKNIVEEKYMSVREEGQKMIIYFSTKDACTYMTNYFKGIYPKIKVGRYIGEDNYEDMLEYDLIITTIKSLGTAIDVPGLRVSLLTDAMLSVQANIQAMGRLRRLKDWPDVTPEFLFLTCSDIKKHLDYHNKKREFLKNRVVGFKSTNSGVKL